MNLKRLTRASRVLDAAKQKRLPQSVIDRLIRAHDREDDGYDVDYERIVMKYQRDPNFNQPTTNLRDYLIISYPYDIMMMDIDDEYTIQEAYDIFLKSGAVEWEDILNICDSDVRFCVLDAFEEVLEVEDAHKMWDEKD